MDPASNANIDDCTIENISLIWDVSFEERVFTGTAVLTVRSLRDGCDVIVLDGKKLSIESVLVDGIDRRFKIEEIGDIFGQKISIQCSPSVKDKTRRVEIAYRTSPEASALQWLSAEQTADKKFPYLFGQCQPIHARSLMPCMDTPAVKQTYEAQVTVPHQLTCLMSALSEGELVKAHGSKRTFLFRQPITVSSYLIAIVVGALERREISSRCAVWAEASIVDKAEAMLAAAEAIAGDYVWGRYDLVVMPPSFPYGGMENPCLTFVTPTLLVGGHFGEPILPWLLQAGDRSLANVIAHEIAHSWTGNLVTNANWEHFWLNEGFTVFLERKIQGRLFGEKLRQFASQAGWEDVLLPTIFERLGEKHEYTKLIQDHRGIDPDDAYTPIPYEKGSAFLLHIEQHLELPLPDGLGPFLKAYVVKFAGKSIFTADWKAFLYEFFADRKTELDAIDWQGWLNQPGLPPAKCRFDESMMESCRDLAMKWIETGDDAIKGTFVDDKAFAAFSVNQKMKFLDSLLHASPLSHTKLCHLDEMYGLSVSGNCEILFTWIRIGIKSRWAACVDRALRFISSQGRLKYVRPIYSDLLAWSDQRATAISQFKTDRATMHPITVAVIEKLIGGGTI